MEIVFGKELDYKEICQIMGEEIKRSGRARNQQLKRWSKHFVIAKPKRGTYIIERKLNEGELIDNHKNYILKLEEICKKRYIKILTPTDEITRYDQEVEYVCEIHNDIIQKTSIYNILKGIGCPLCKYPMSRFEVMLHLGMENSLHRHKLDGVEFDIILPKEKIAVEVDGFIYHSGKNEKQREAHKYEVAEKNGYRLIKIYEQDLKDNKGIYREGDKIYTLPYSQMNKEKQQKTIEIIQQILPYVHSDNLWDKAADYMREWKHNLHQLEDNDKTKHSIKQYDANGNLVYEYKNFDEIKKMIALGNAFGFKWEIE